MKAKHLILISLWCVFILIVTFLAMNTQQGRYDFITYHHNAERIADGGVLYGSYTNRFDYIYPPLLAQSIAPLTAFLDLDAISLGWHILSLVLLAISVWLVNSTIEHPTQRFVFWLMPILFVPSYQSMWVGQISMVMLFCFTAAWFAYRKDRPYITGAFLALATWLKVYPVFLILYFMWKRDWKVTLSAFLVGMGLLGLQVLLSDVNTVSTYFLDVLPGLTNNGQMPGLFKNSSILGFTYKLFIENADIIPLVDNATLATISRWLMTLIIVGGGFYMISRPTSEKTTEISNARFDLEYGTVILISLLFASTLWVSGMPPLIICYQLILKQKLHRRIRQLTWVSFTVVSYYFLYLMGFQPENKLSGLILSMGFYGLFLLWGLYISQLRKVGTERQINATSLESTTM